MAINDSAINGGVINGTLSQAAIELSSIKVEYPGVFSGKLLPTLSSITVLKSGHGFMEGDLFGITNNSSKILVKSCYNSGITAIEYVNFGHGHYDTFQQILYPSTTKQYATATATISSGKITAIDIIDSGSGYSIAPTVYIIGGGGKAAKATCTVSGGSISTITITEDGADYTHTPSIVFDSEVAVIQHNIGTYRKYPGYYVDSNSLISDESFIQDGYYYQTYSYELEVDVLFDKYKNVIKRLLHPSGYNVFGSLTKFDVKDIISAIKLISLQIDQFPNDNIFPFDSFVKNMTKIINESTSPLVENVLMHLTREIIDENISVSDVFYLVRIMLITDSTSFQENISKQTFKTFNDSTQNVTDSVIIPPFKTLIINDTNLRAHSINPNGVYGTSLNNDYFAQDYAEYVENFTKTL